jgi:hypothetical protein
MEGLMTEPPKQRRDEQAPAVASNAAERDRRVPVSHAAAASLFDPVEVRRDFVEVSMDFSRLVEALGPDILFDVPKAFRGERNALPVRSLISAQAATLPGFVAELTRADPLRHPAFRVEGHHERDFVAGLRAVLREILLEPRPVTSEADGAGEPAAAKGR